MGDWMIEERQQYRYLEILFNPNIMKNISLLFLLIVVWQKLDPTRIWDACYMTASEMGDDGIDEPQPYKGERPWVDMNTCSEDPYSLGNLD